MNVHARFTLAIFALILSASGATLAFAGEQPNHVVDESELQPTIDHQLVSADADRQAIRTLLELPGVRRVAGTAGLDLARASAAVATLSGSELESLALQARQVGANLSGGDGTIVLSATALIIILLIIILIAD